MLQNELGEKLGETFKSLFDDPRIASSMFRGGNSRIVFREIEDLPKIEALLGSRTTSPTQADAKVVLINPRSAGKIETTFTSTTMSQTCQRSMLLQLNQSISELGGQLVSAGINLGEAFSEGRFFLYHRVYWGRHMHIRSETFEGLYDSSGNLVTVTHTGKLHAVETVLEAGSNQGSDDEESFPFKIIRKAGGDDILSLFPRTRDYSDEIKKARLNQPILPQLEI